MDDRRNRARALVADALAAVEAELSAPRHAVRPEELGAAREALRGYLAGIDSGALPPRRERGEGLGKMILDAWPYELPLGTLVLRAERAWRNA
ncbi:MAG TPA: hypothetical protein VF912_02565 [Anaeromyxobacter sp.]